MPASPTSPTASFYDMSDDEEGEYSTIRPRPRQSSTSMAKGVKLLYAKSKVYVHPSPSAKDNLPGFLALMQQKPSSSSTSTSTTTSTSPPTSPTSSSKRPADRSSLLLAWVPESGLGDATAIYTKVEQQGGASGDDEPKQSHLVPAPPVTTSHSGSIGAYAFSIPLSEIFSILVRPPSSGWWFGSIVLNTRGGESFPALFFHDSECQSTIDQRKRLQRENFSIEAEGGGIFWGGDELLRWLKRYVTVERSAQEPSVYLVDPNDVDKLSFGGGGKPTPDKVRNVLEGKHKDETAQQRRKDGPDVVAQVLKQARWSFLEKMSQVTTFTRRTAQAVAENRNLPPQVRRLMQDPQVQTVSDEFDSARLYLARWAMGIAEQSEREKNQRVWTAKDVLEMEESEVGAFEVLDIDAQGLSLADKRKPVTLKEWNGFFNARTGRLERTVDEVKERIFHGGLDPDDGVRKEAWLFLLGVYEWDSSKDERHAHMNSLRDEYIRLKGAWWERMVDEQGTLEEREWWKEQKMRIEKDVHRTDRHLPLFAGEDIPHPDPDSPFAEAGTNVHLEQMKDLLLTYNEHNRALGYVQGMSDLLAPLYAIQQDDAAAFWAFVGFMRRMERNFLRDQSGMRLQLLTLNQLCALVDPVLHAHLLKLDSTNFFFFFRMLLVWFKREFSFPEICRLWEGLWTDFLSAEFPLFVAMAVLERHRSVILEHLRGFDEVLKYVNELSGSMDLAATIVGAEACFRRFRRIVEKVDRREGWKEPSTVRRRLPVPEGQGGESTGMASGREGTGRGKAAAAVEDTGESEKRISPELRALLSREVVGLDAKEVRERGGGVGS